MAESLLCKHPVRAAGRILGMQEWKDHNSHTGNESIAELVRRALIQAGDMQAAEEKLKQIAQRSSAAVLDPENTKGNTRLRNQEIEPDGSVRLASSDQTTSSVRRDTEM